MSKKGFPFFVLLLLHTLCFTQSRRFQHITSTDGISQSEVYSFLEDSRGFMWFGMVDGLNRYDGYNITVFNTNKEDPNSIANNTIRSLAEDQFGNVWIGTDDGLSVYDPSSEEIYQVKVSGFENVLFRINSILADKEFLLLGTSSGLLKAEINTTNLEKIGREFQVVKFSENFRVSVNSVIRSKNGSVWISTPSSVFRLIFQKKTSNPIVIERIANKNFTSNRNLLEDKNGNLWIITRSNGFFRYNPTSKKLDRFTENSPNRTIVSSGSSSVASDINGNLWLGTRDKGLFFLKAKNLNDENPQFEHIQNDPFDEKSLNSNLIFSLYVSKNNLLWIGTIGSGINMYDPQQKEFNHYKIPVSVENVKSGSNFIRSVFADPYRNIWIGTHNNGLYIFKREKNTFHKAGFGTQSIFFIYDIGNNYTLICTSSGLSVGKLIDNELNIQSTISSSANFYACKSKEDIIWIASLEGVRKCRFINRKLEVEKVYNINSKPGISFNNCRVLYYSKEEHALLVGTEGGGLNILELDKNHDVTNVSTYKKNNTPTSISNNYLRSITKDSSGDFWIGTYEGLNKVLRDSSSGEISFKSYTKKDGLPNNMIQLLVEDNQENIWIGTNSGLCKFNPQNEKFIQYSVSEGIQSNEFSEHTVFKKPDGEIIVGGINGINTFYPDRIHSNNNNPNTTITGFYLFNKKVDIINAKNGKSPLKKSITLTDSIFLQPTQNSFGFDFSAMLHSHPEKVRYAYMLEGFDEDWNETDAKNRRANYTNLGYGKYTFLVKSTINDGKWEETPQTIFIHIKTPFVFTWMAFVIYILFVVLVIVYFTNYSVIKYATKKKMLLENEHNQKLHELDEIRTRFFINISHDLRTPLTLISSPLEMVLKNKGLKPEIKNQLKLIQRNVKKLKYITEQLLDIRKAETGKLAVRRQKQDIVSFIKMEAMHFTHAVKNKGLGLNIISIEEAIHTGFDADMISKTLFNLLSNAIKYTNEGEIDIRIEKVSVALPDKLKNSEYDSFIKVDIQDSGEGISQQELDKIFERYYQGKGKTTKGYGIGLSHCKDLIEAHGGIIEAISEKGVGTTFRFFIPNIKTAEVNPTEMEFIAANTEDVYIESIHAVSVENSSPVNTGARTILVIEDNLDMRSFLKNGLKKKYNVFEAKDGIEGLEIASKHSPDLIVSDVMMPNMDGIEFCEKVKSDISTSHIPVILLTAKVEAEAKYEGIEKGADDYISKPFEMEYLSLRINNLLKTRERLRKSFQVNNSLEPSAVTVTSLDEEFLSQLMSAIERGIPDPKFTINSLESEMGMSHSNFYRKIKSLTGQSGKKILFNMRMKRAKQILTDNKGIRICEVAYMTGFSNPKYFSKCFKEFYGVLPSEFMNKANSTSHSISSVI